MLTGSGSAALEGLSLAKNHENVLLISGDVPLVTPETISSFIQFYFSKKAKAAVLTAIVSNPASFGRIVRGASGEIEKIVEEPETDAVTARINEINSGIYIFDAQ